MKIGLSPLQGQASFDETLRECERAETSGFDSIWLGEHHNNPILHPAPLVGLAAVFVAAAALYAPEAFGIGVPGAIHAQALIEMSIGVAIGAFTFTGSVIAFAKLNGNMSGKPIILPARHLIHIVLGIVLLVVACLVGPGGYSVFRGRSHS